MADELTKQDKVRENLLRAGPHGRPVRPQGDQGGLRTPAGAGLAGAYGLEALDRKFLPRYSTKAFEFLPMDETGEELGRFLRAGGEFSDDLYHTTVDKPGVLRNRFQAGSELDINALGGSPDRTISTTHSKAHAKKIKNTLIAAGKAARGEMSAVDVIRFMRKESGIHDANFYAQVLDAPTEMHDEIAKQVHGETDEAWKILEDYLEGKRFNSQPGDASWRYSKTWKRGTADPVVGDIWKYTDDPSLVRARQAIGRVDIVKEAADFGKSGGKGFNRAQAYELLQELDREAAIFHETGMTKKAANTGRNVLIDVGPKTQAASRAQGRGKYIDGKTIVAKDAIHTMGGTTSGPRRPAHALILNNRAEAASWLEENIDTLKMESQPGVRLSDAEIKNREKIWKKVASGEFFREGGKPGQLPPFDAAGGTSYLPAEAEIQIHQHGPDIPTRPHSSELSIPQRVRRYGYDIATEPKWWKKPLQALRPLAKAAPIVGPGIEGIMASKELSDASPDEQQAFYNYFTQWKKPDKFVSGVEGVRKVSDPRNNWQILGDKLESGIGTALHYSNPLPLKSRRYGDVREGIREDTEMSPQTNPMFQGMPDPRSKKLHEMNEREAFKASFPHLKST